MIKRWRITIILCVTMYAVFWVLNGLPKDGVWDTIAFRIANGGSGDGSEVKQREMENYGEEIFNAEFEATWEMGVRRKSNVVGQIFDFLRFPDKNANISVRVYAEDGNTENLNKTALISI